MFSVKKGEGPFFFKGQSVWYEQKKKTNILRFPRRKNPNQNFLLGAKKKKTFIERKSLRKKEIMGKSVEMSSLKSMKILDSC